MFQSSVSLFRYSLNFHRAKKLLLRKDHIFQKFSKGGIGTLRGSPKGEGRTTHSKNSQKGDLGIQRGEAQKEDARKGQW